MIYENEKLRNISFPLGGIGTGCIGLAGNGSLKEWEIFNRPNKNGRNGYSHFAIKAMCGGKSTAKVLQGDCVEDLIGTPCASKGHYAFGYGPHESTFAGFPHFRSVTFDGTFPMATLTFEDADFPAVVRLRAFNPLIPHDDLASSLPAAFFEWEIENVTDEAVRFAIASTVCNPARSTKNRKIAEGGRSGVFLGSDGTTETDIAYSDLSVLTDASDVDVQAYWYRGRWMDGCTTYWKNFTQPGRMPERHYAEPARKDHGTVVAYVDVPARERARIRFVIAWNVPNAYNYWRLREGVTENPTWRNYYATVFGDSEAVAAYAIAHFGELYEKTALFSETLQSSTLPETVKDAISANLSVLKTPTVLRLEDGSFWAWEGCSEKAGSCYGSCQHVWNYAYALPFLFPRLERSLRETTLKYALQDSGATSFRVNLPRQKEISTARACVDGQMGEVFKCYREWKISGDDEWLEAHAEGIFRMLEYAWSPENPDGWDADMDGVLEGRQHHTLDMELFGPSSWLEGMYLLALDCGARMARHLGDAARAELYTRLYENGKRWMNEHLFNGSYFCQRIDLTDRSLVDRFDAADSYWNDEAGEIKYQIGEGCIIDQLLADFHALLIGADSVYAPEKKRIALESLYRNNYKSSMREVVNMWRNFSLEDERGTLICSYPEGARVPAIPIPYCEETMTGFEYALAALMIAEGFVAEGERMVGAIRDRYDGEKRNPWNEIECGSNYARSMASYALLSVYSGFTYDMTEGYIGFSPIGDAGRYLFSVGESWGSVALDRTGCRISVLGEPLTLRSVSVPNGECVTEVTVDGRRVSFMRENGRIVFDRSDIRREIVLR